MPVGGKPCRKIKNVSWARSPDEFDFENSVYNTVFV